MPTPLLHRPFDAARAALLASLVGAGLAAPAAAQGIELDYLVGRLDARVTFVLQGQPLDVVVFLPSGLPGPTPLSIVDPLDPRLLQVGVDLLPYLTIEILNAAGQGQLGYKLTPIAALAGAPLYAQGVALSSQFPGPPVFGDLTNPARLSLLLPGQSSLTQDPMNGPRRFHSANTVPGGPVGSERVLLAGGELPTGPFAIRDDWEIYDPVLETFVSSGSLLERRSRHASIALLDGTVLFLGGIGGAAGDPLATVERYLPQLDAVQAVAPMASPRVDHTATRLADGRVLVVGGFSGPYTQDDPIGYPASFLGNGLGPTTFAPQAELFDPISGTWTPIPSIGPRAGHAAVLLGDGSVLIAGGVVPVSPTQPGVTSSALRFDPVTLTAVPTQNLPSDRAFVSMSPALGGNALLSGGGDVTFGGPQAVIDNSTKGTLRYDTTSGQWQSIAGEPSTVGRAFVRCIRMEDGTIRYIRIERPDDRVDPGSAGIGPPRVHRLDLVNGAWILDGTLLERRPGMRLVDLESKTRCLVSGAADIVLVPGSNGDVSVEAYPYPSN